MFFSVSAYLAVKNRISLRIHTRICLLQSSLTINSRYNVEIYSEAHWELIDKYIAVAADMGINMILVPTHTPPLDTAVGTVRPCVQLVDIEKKGNKYEFSFGKFKRFIVLAYAESRDGIHWEKRKSILFSLHRKEIIMSRWLG